jgi:ribonuclease HII
MILAGIDEAGYGPLLGPLVVGCCAFEIKDVDALAPLPCLWKRLRKSLSKSRSRTRRKLHFNDSKQVYNPSLGLHELERSILTLAIAMNLCADDTAKLLDAVAPHVLDDLPQYPWYDGRDARFPIENDGTSLRLCANALRLEMNRSETHCVHLAARIVLERQLNRMIAATRNKSSALFSTAAIHLDQLIRKFGEKNLVIICDRQGARDRYGSLLRTMFEDWSLEIASENDGRSEYRMHREPHIVRIIFVEKAESQCLSVAAASMLSKYLRELLMHRFNHFWKTHLPDLHPTAGYYTDGERFLRDIAAKKNELGIRDEELVRCR